jgi:hypothetical protein
MGGEQVPVVTNEPLLVSDTISRSGTIDEDDDMESIPMTQAALSTTGSEQDLVKLEMAVHRIDS